MSNIRVDVDYALRDGLEMKFRSPVDCSQITGLIVYYPGEDGNITSKVFALADAHGNNVGDIDHLFAEDVVVKVILDVTKGMAFVQNADTNAYLEAQLAGKAPAGYDLVNLLSAQGWYKIGTLAPASFETACATFYIGGSFSNTKPTPSIVDVVITSSGANAKTRVSTHDLRQIVRVGLIAETPNLFGVYVFYENNSSNWVQIHVDTINGTFTPADFVASSVAESNMITVAYLDEWENPPMQYGVEYRTTERWNGKAVWTALINLGQLTTGALRVTTDITVTNLIRHSGFSKDSLESTSFPALFLSSQYDSLGQWIIARTAESGTVMLTAMRGSGYSRSATIYCQLWYTKD